MKRKLIKNETRDEERAYYASFDCDFENITISGPADGESAWKESKNIIVKDSKMALRYPFWHVTNLRIENSEFADTCRAPLWYSTNIGMIDCKIRGVKSYRECNNIKINHSSIISEEPFWRVSDVKIKNSEIEGFYAFFQSKDIDLEKVKFKGKYSFQYTENVEINDSELDTKDAFWHAKNVTVKNSIVKGEYLGWYSENLTLINCKITGTQPLCYAKGLKIIDCTMEGCDLAFEYSEVNAMIVGHISSIKNPLKGKIICEKCETLIVDEHDRSSGEVELLEINEN